MKNLLLFTTTLLITLTAATAKEANLLFIENVGQVTDQYHQPRTDIHFSMQAPGMDIFIGTGAIHYQFAEAKQIQPAATTDPSLPAHLHTSGPSIINSHRIDLELIGANKNAVLVKQGQLKYYERYYTPQFAGQGGLAHSYSRIVYKDIYPHIDWAIYINGDKLEYDFILHQGADPDDIRLRYNGASYLHIDAKGNLVADCATGTITEHAPVAYQSDGRQIAASFVLNSNIVSYTTASYHGTLLIDPYIEWATYYGGAGDDGGYAVTEDASGNSYFCGSTNGGNQIATLGAYDVSYADSVDAFLVKFNSSGSRLWATYYGGSAIDNFVAMAYDHHGGIVVGGATSNATGITTLGSDQPIFTGPYTGGNSWGGGGDAFIVKFDTSGTRVWGTYFGGPSTDGFWDIECDQAGYIYLVGGASSQTAIATVGAHQTTSDGSDGFVAKYNSNGQKVWCTYYGGNDADQIFDVALSTDNRLYVSGWTYSTSGIATPGTFQPTKLAAHASFIAAFDSSGLRLWGTYFGGDIGTTHLSSLCVDASNNIYVAGWTRDTSPVMTTLGCYQSFFGGGGNSGFVSGDAIIAKFNSSGNRAWSTYFGGSGDEGGQRIALNNVGEIIIAGVTTSPNNIAVNAFQGIYGGDGLDGWLTKFSNAGSCIWSTYLGGSSWDWIFDMDVFDDHIYVCGRGFSFPTTIGSFAPNNYGGEDAYFAKFHDFPTGLSQPQQTTTSMNLYPNPNSGAFTISGTTQQNEEHHITITSITGQQVHTETFTGTTQLSRQIQLGPHLPPGLYILTLTTANTSITQRFIKN